ncbi:hypothetical protein B0H65DRAFT_551741 [Neurospora tetraspora]|uniref:Uncharacterized protein n=1 Tax=Neurospora tetraspora TaxID=94610 RepID=A0AAE0J8J2_9PEZI|nr:hypothetical protein B0H65DRAFT_551741 [Neurospora tetraspora]
MYWVQSILKWVAAGVKAVSIAAWILSSIGIVPGGRWVGILQNLGVTSAGLPTTLGRMLG